MLTYPLLVETEEVPNEGYASIAFDGKEFHRGVKLLLHLCEEVAELFFPLLCTCFLIQASFL